MSDAKTEALIEREHEVAALSRALTDASSNAGNVVVAEGPAGIGKSRLLATACAEAAQRGLDVLFARGVELERDVPFGVAAELFSPRLAAATDEQRATLLAGHAGFAEAVLDPQVPAPEDAQALVRGLYWLTVNLSTATRGLLIAVDDAHWADAPTLGFLAHLAARVRELPVALVLAVRSGERAEGSASVDWLTTQPDHRILRPVRLTDHGVGLMVAAEWTAPEPAFVTACARVSGGNPFLARELVRSLRADGIVATAGSVAMIERLVPASVVQSVLVRLARLGDAAQRLASAVVVLGSGASIRHAAALADLTIDEATRVADALARAHVLAADAPLRFSHPLIATAVSADLPRFARAGAHRRAADLLAADGASAEAVVVHLLLSEPDGEPATVAALRLAAQRTLARGDPSAAARLLRRALAEPPPLQERADLLLELAEAEVQAGNTDAGRHVDAALTLLREPAERVRALVPLARLRFHLGEHEGSARAVQEALAVLEPDDPIAQALMVDELTATLFRAPLRPRAEALLQPLVDAAQAGRTPDHPGLLAHLALRMAFGGAAPARVRELAERATSASPLVDPASHGILMGIVVQALSVVDELELGERIADAALDLGRRSGALLSFSLASFHRAIPRYQRGALRDALADIEQSLTARNEGWTAASGWLDALQAHVHLALGDSAAARAALMVSDFGTDGLEHAVLLSARAQLALAEGAPAAALADAEAAGRQLTGVFGIEHPGFIPWRCMVADAALALGDHDRAQRLANEDLARARETRAPRAIGVALRCAARSAPRARSIELLYEAIGVLERSPATLELAGAQVELGAALRRTGQRTAARTPLRVGLQLADASGAVALAETARQELRATGARPRRAAWTGADALTPSERRVAQLAAEGLTNVQIAQALFVTPKTIQTHLAHTYRKLGIGSRRQLPVALTTV
jgi:DNA-binding CsgD family transcriptional regulator